jgi:hypothetical protein
MDAARPFEAARAHVAVMAPRNVVRLPVAEAEAVEYTVISGDTPEMTGGELSAVAASASARRADRAQARVDVLRRRQRVLMGLMAAAIVSLAAAVLMGDTRLWAVHGVVVVAFAAYLGGLRRLKRLAVERRAKVRHFPAAAAATAPSPASARSEPRRAATR